MDTIINPNFENIAQIPNCLASKTIEGPALPLEGVDDVHGRDGLAASMLRVGDSVANDILKEDLEDATCLLVDETADTLHTTTPCKTANCRLGDSLNVIPQNLAVTLGSSLSQTLASLSSSRHGLG